MGKCGLIRRATVPEFLDLLSDDDCRRWRMIAAEVIGVPLPFRAITLIIKYLFLWIGAWYPRDCQKEKAAFIVVIVQRFTLNFIK